MSYHIDSNAECTYNCFQNSSETVTKLLQSLPSDTQQPSELSPLVINQSQWNRLQRQALPMQLQPTWLSYFKESVAQRYHMCRLLRCLEENQDDIALATLHAAEQITFDIFLAARQLVLHNQYLRKRQKEYAQIIYIDALENLVRFHNQSLIADAEFALSQTLPEVTRVIVAAVDRSINKYRENIDATIAQAMSQRCAELREIVASTPIGNTTEAACMQWRASLPSHQFVLT